MPPQESDTALSKPFRMLDLPRELRDRIYRELLLPDKTRIYLTARLEKREGKSAYLLQPAILRTSKQVHTEASRVLYKETNWVLVTAEQCQSNFSERDWLFGKLCKRCNTWVSMHRVERFPGTPVLEIKVTDGRSGHPKYRAMLLTTLQDVHYVCLGLRWLHLEVNLSFDVQAMQNPRTREVLLDCCRDIRGLAKATIVQLRPSATHAELLALMEQPIKHVREFSERADRYKERGELQTARGHLLDAADIHSAGWVFLQYFFCRGLVVRLDGVNPQVIAELKEKQVTFGIECADCRTKAGTHKEALYWLSMMLRSAAFPAPRAFTDQQYSSIKYRQALSLVAQRNDFRAAKYFREVLSLQPGHKGADDQLDAMDARLGTISGTKRRTLEAYLTDFVGPYRHREPGSARLSQDLNPVGGASNTVI